MPDLVSHNAFNMFVGDAGPDNSKHLNLKNMKLPEMEEMTQQHHSGGSWGALDVGALGMKELMCSFKITGWDEQTMSQFGINPRVKYPWTAYGSGRSLATGIAIPIKAVMWGRLVAVKMPEMKRGDLMEVDYEVKEMTHYELYYKGKEKYYWDWQTTLFRVDGVVQNQDEIDNLAIPTANG